MKTLLIKYTGGFYSKEPMTAWEHALSLTKLEFQFMGYSEVQGILAEGMNAGDDIKSANLKKSIEQVQSIAQAWHK